MRFAVLGAVAARTDAGEPILVPEAKVRALLAALLAHRGETVSADRLVAHLWPARLPADPRTALQARVSQLRRALDEAESGARALVVSEGAGYVLRGATVDADEFDEALTAARRQDRPAPLLTRALGLWRGEAFGGRHDDLVAPEAIRLDELRLVAREERAAAVLDEGGGAELVAELGGLVEAHPLRERLRAVWMRALYRAGRPHDALATYRDLVEHLRSELGTDPGPELVALHRSVLEHAPELGTDTAPVPLPVGVPAPPPLPTPLTSLVGRDAAQAQVAAALRTHRLVTLIGPGGVGKTRLALAVGHDAATGARFAELDRLPAGADACDVVTAVAVAHGVRDAVSAGDPDASVEQLAAALRTRGELLVLDNAEHVLPATAGVVAALLAAVPELRILVSSRESLDVPGEVVVPVEPLPTTGADAAAVALFTERARAVDPEVVLDPATVTAVCRRLDGIPLALELAAARVRALGVAGLLDRLDDRFAVLARRHGGGGPERQRTLRSALDWSWELLDDDERAIARRLAPCVGGCTAATATVLAADDAVSTTEVADLLGRLVDRSWLTVGGQGDERRYRMLESIAAYAREALVESGEDRALRDRHLAHVVALVEDADEALRGPDQRRWLAVLDAEEGNLRAALEHALLTDVDAALRLVDAAGWYWFLRGRADVGIRAARRALSALAGHPGPEPPAAEAVRVWRAGLSRWSRSGEPDADDELDVPGGGLPLRTRFLDAYSRWAVNHPRDQLAVLTVLVDDARRAGDTWVEATTLATRASVHLTGDDIDTAAADAADARALLTTVGDGWGLLQVTSTESMVALVWGDRAAAAASQREGLAIAHDLGLVAEESAAHSSLGRVWLVAGDLGAAERELDRGLALALDQGNLGLADYARFGLALLWRRRGDLDAAEQVLLDWTVRRTELGRADHSFAALPEIELGFVAEQRGDPARALAHHHAGHALADGSPRTLALALEGMAAARSLRTEPAEHVEAARLLGAATAARARLRAPLGPGERGDVDRARARLVAALGEDVLRREEAHGAADPPPPRAT